MRLTTQSYVSPDRTALRYAWLSNDQRYTYSVLESHSDNTGDRTLLWVLLSPKIETLDNPSKTTKRVLSRGRRLGYARTAIIYLHALRQSDSDTELSTFYDPTGPFNNHVTHAVLGHQNPMIADHNQPMDIVCAWGDKGNHLDRAFEFGTLLQRMGKQALCYGLTAQGHPASPYSPICMRDQTPLIPFDLESFQRTAVRDPINDSIKVTKVLAMA